MTHKTRYTLCRDLHDLVLRWQLKNRAISSLHGTGIQLAESHVLSEIDSAPHTTPRELAVLLDFDRSSITRIISRLRAAGILAQASRRGEYLSITPTGRRIIKIIDREANRLLALFSRSLTRLELAQLEGDCRKLCDGFQHPPGIRRRGEHPMRLQQRRIARCFGLTRSTFMSSGIAVSHWQILTTVCESAIPMTPSSLAAALAIPQAIVSSILSTLSRRGYLTLRPSLIDRRSVRVHPTEKGQKFSDRVASVGAQQVQHAARHLSLVELKRLVRLLGRFLGEKSSPSSIREEGYRIAPLEQEVDCRAARQRWIRELNTSCHSLEVPARIFSPEVSPLGLFKGRKLCGALQRENSNGIVKITAWWTHAPRLVTAEFLRLGSEIPE